MLITRVKVQGEKLDTYRVSQIDSIYTKLSSSIDVLLVFNFKRVIELLMTISIFSQIRLIINKHISVVDTCVYNSNRIG
jgi:hypothetical protein